MPRVAEVLETQCGWSDVQVEIIDNARHYLPDGRPQAVAELIEHYASP